MAQNTQSFGKSRPLWLLQQAQLEICPADNVCKATDIFLQSDSSPGQARCVKGFWQWLKHVYEQPGLQSFYNS